MAADLYIHVVTDDLTDADMHDWLGHSLGSKHFTWARVHKANQEAGREDGMYHRISATPNVWIGEVSWLKAAIFDDPGDFVSNTVGAVSELIGEDLPVLDDDLTYKIMAAFDAPNETGYSLADPVEVRAFLDQHQGRRVFTVSW